MNLSSLGMNYEYGRINLSQINLIEIIIRLLLILTTKQIKIGATKNCLHFDIDTDLLKSLEIHCPVCCISVYLKCNQTLIKSHDHEDSAKTRTLTNNFNSHFPIIPQD
jgi:hypothetical protein